MFTCLIALVSWVGTLGPLTLGVDPAIKAIVTYKGLQYGSHIGAGWFQSMFASLPIPDIEGDFGPLHYTLSGMRMVQYNLPEPTVGFCNGTGIKAGIDGMSIAIQGKWKTQFSFLQDGGSFELAVFSMGMSSLVQVGSDDQGHLSIAGLQCDSRIGTIQVNFHGGASWMFQPFVRYFQGYIKPAIQGKLCPMINQAIKELEGHLMKMKVSVQVNRDLLIEIPLVVAPNIQVSDMELGFKGEFYGLQAHIEPPFSAAPFELPLLDQSMLTLGLSEFCLNSASFAYFTMGVLQANITDNMIPKTSPFRLNTSSLGNLIPQLPKLFPDMLVLLQTYATNSPTVSFEPNNVMLTLSGSAKAYAIKSNSTLIPLFRLDMTANFSGKVFVSDGKVKGSLALSNLTLALGSSEIGTFQTAALEKVLQLGINVALPKVNAKLKAGMPLPTPYNVSWVNPTLTIHKGFVALDTDVAISPPTNKEL